MVGSFVPAGSSFFLSFPSDVHGVFYVVDSVFLKVLLMVGFFVPANLPSFRRAHPMSTVLHVGFPL